MGCKRLSLTIFTGCRTLKTAQSLIQGLPRTEAISIDVSSREQIDPVIAKHDLTISLVPFIYHADVIKSAIEAKKNVVTTSYVSPAVRALDGDAKAAGITVLNEVGVDPGFDHLYAIKIIGEVHDKGGKVREFYSYCGGIPAPEHAGNPLGFKFSWSPRGALLSQRNSASFISQGKQVDISPQDLMASSKPYYVMDGYDFVAYPNRDSVPFRDFYNIPEAHTVVRGSLRYDGNPMFVQALADMGWLDGDRKTWLVEGIKWNEIFQKLVNASSSSESDLIPAIQKICNFPTKAESDRIISGLRYFGLFGSELATIVGGNPLDTLCGRLEHMLSYQPGERDLVMLQHKFVIEWADGKMETRTSTLELLGDPNGYSGMAKSVGVTCGVATQLLLDGHPSLNKPGVLAPYTKEICDPIRELVNKEGLKMVEKVVS
ncbi:hypothetical protein R6Q59_010226 [Mikania micrantha]